MHCRHYLVTGRVQGVNFRRFTQARATALGLTGWVRNLIDGRVEILASGTDDQLVGFEAEIARGPALAQVDDIVKRVTAEELPFVGFRIKEDGEAPWQEKK